MTIGSWFSVASFISESPEHFFDKLKYNTKGDSEFMISYEQDSNILLFDDFHFLIIGIL